jgi:hypothetical protein
MTEKGKIDIFTQSVRILAILKVPLYTTSGSTDCTRNMYEGEGTLYLFSESGQKILSDIASTTIVRKAPIQSVCKYFCKYLNLIQECTCACTQKEFA